MTATRIDISREVLAIDEAATFLRFSRHSPAREWRSESFLWHLERSPHHHHGRFREDYRR